ncbi:MAG: TetR/AcrR family transcriptional regulator [Sphingobacteriaceae bacterium]|nr:TetR/AcrR family transcriptional regulator [Sphingobacteriaceae bacterium]
MCKDAKKNNSHGNLQDLNSFHSFVSEMEAKDKILIGAEQLFFKYGIKSVTMDEIAKNIGMSKKTIYQFFKDKDDLVHHLFKNKIALNKSITEKIHQEAENVVSEIFALMRMMREMLANMNPIIFHDLHKYYPITFKIFEDFKNECMLNHIEKSLLKGQEQNLVRMDINIKILSRMRLENLNSGFFGRIFPPDKYTMLEVQLEMTEHFLYGVCTLKGHKLINKFKNVIED